MKFFKIFILVFTLFASTQALAAEIFSFVDQSCRIQTGFIIDASEEEVFLLNLEGRGVKLEKEFIRFVLSYDILESPIKKITPSEILKQNLREIYVNQSSKPIFAGWPIKLVEDLVIFYDTEGNIQVIQMTKITRVKDVKKLDPIASLKHHNFYFSLGDVESYCSKNGGVKRTRGEKVFPTRIYGDQIQIEEFLSNFRNNFVRFRSYQERTHLYSKPILFKQATRLGFNVIQNKVENPVETTLPLYVQWGRGEAYRFQSFYQIGGVAPEVLPSVEPQSLLRSDLKSHLFHGSFIGNLNALPAGTEYYSNTQTLFFPLSDKNQKLVHTTTSLNYLALMGIDWNHWSFSVANYYPIHLIQVKNVFREVLATASSPLFRVMYTTKNWRLRGMFAKADYGTDSGADDSQISISNQQSVVGIIEAFDLSNTMLRFGVDYEVKKDVMVSMDQIITQGQYNETTNIVTGSFVDFNHSVSQLKVEHGFGEYVNMFATLTYFNIKRSYNIESEIGSETVDQFALGGSFEFIF